MSSNRRNTGLESTTALYKHVINEVCEKVQSEFINAGIDESVLHDLKWLWRRNVAKSQCCAHEQEAADEFAEFGFKIEELKQQQQSESEDQDEQQNSKSQMQQAQDVDDDDDDLSPITDDEQPVEQQSQSTAEQGTLQFLPLTSTTNQQSSSKRKRADDDDQKKSNDQPRSKKTLNTSKLDAQKQNLDEVDLGSDLDDSSDQEEEEEVEDDHADDNNTPGQQSGKAAQSGNSSGVKKSKSQPAGLILCQYDKVTRSRNKWKTQLRDGVANVNGRDYVFSRAQLEFQF